MYVVSHDFLSIPELSSRHLLLHKLPIPLSRYAHYIFGAEMAL